MILTFDTLKPVISNPRAEANLLAFFQGLKVRGETVGLMAPAILAQFLGQCAHESAGFVYDEEIWGPTPAQKRYDTRTDLGNTAARDGDGFLYRGRTGIMITGKHNYEEFTKWCRAFDPSAPDFVQQPDLILADPWEGLVPIWFWQTRDLNRYAEVGDIEMVTRRINGGLNGYADRIKWYTKFALLFLEIPDVKSFQSAYNLVVDGDVGPKTRAKLHEELLKLEDFTFEPKPKAALSLLQLLLRILFK